MSNVVQSLWIGPRLSPLQIISIRSFLAHGHDYHLYAYEEIADVPKGATICDASTILPRESMFCYQDGFGKGSYSAFSNQFRYKLLFEQGGWWVDADVVCLRQFDFEDEFVFATEFEDDYTAVAGTCVLKSQARSEYLNYCLQVCDGKDKAKLKWGEIGPRLLNIAIRRFDLTRHCVPVHVFSLISWFEFSEILKPGFDVSRLANSYGLHLWNQMWRSKGIDPDEQSHATSLYGMLRTQYLADAD